MQRESWLVKQFCNNSNRFPAVYIASHFTRVHILTKSLLNRDSLTELKGSLLFTQASVGKPESQNACRFVLVAKRGVVLPGVLSVRSRNWEWEFDCLRYRVLALREKRNLQNSVFCERKNYALYAHLVYKDVDRFRNGSVRELYRLKAWQISKVHTRSHEIT